ncbi:MAG: DUF362 domain-containing protein [bacterium]|nr:DUF362 domain-containing protein [bacterium]
MPEATVGLARKGNRRDNVYAALDLVRQEVTPKIAEQVLLKPNFLSSTNTLSSTQADAIRGAIDFLLSTPRPPGEILIAEGGNEKESGDAFKNFGFHALQDEYKVPIRLVDLNQETRWETTSIFLNDGTEYQVHMPRTVLDCPCTLSVAVAKTHDVCVVTLALKNMIMGTIRKEDRVKMHGFMTHKERLRPQESQAITINLIRVAKFLSPDISVIDGTMGIQGNGPDGTDAVALGVAAASADVFAADAVMAKVMGYEPLDLGLLYYGNHLGIGIADLQNINVLGTPIDDVQTSVKHHDWIEDQRQWRKPDAMSRIQA